jgi:hypothetical protein
LKKPNWFSIVILFIAIIFTVVAFGFTPRAMIIPLVVALPVLLLITLQVLTELFPDMYTKTNLHKIRDDSKVNLENKSDVNNYSDRINNYGDSGEQESSKLFAAASLGIMLILMWLFGFIIGGMIYIAAYYRYFSRESWITSIVTALLVGVISYGLFGYILKANLWMGVIF